jgi:phosphatidate cytidylyltransferase
MTTTLLLPVLAVLAPVSGALLIAGLAGNRLRGADGVAHHDPAHDSGVRIALWWGLAGIAAALPPAIAIGAFAVVSAFALAEFFAMAPHRRHDTALRNACFVAIPLQYAFVATHSFGLFVATLPLAATLALPLLALRAGDTRDLLDRVAECGWGVLACVYCVSHAAAILMLDIPGGAARSGGLVAFLVVVAKADDVYRYALRRFSGVAALTQTTTLARIVAGVAGSALAAAALGAALAWLTPFTTVVAAAAALLIALLGTLGRFVMACVDRERPPAGTVPATAWRRALGRPGAIAFSAPVFYYLLHALYGP